MQNQYPWENTSPLDQSDGPTRLTAHIVAPDRPRRILGYEVDSDLSPHYSFAELMLLMLTGEIPDAAIGRAFESALSRLAPVAIAEAPTHAAMLTHLIGANSAGLVGTASLLLAERARTLLSMLEPFLNWLAAQEGPPPKESLAGDNDDVRCLDAMRVHLTQLGVSVSALVHPLNRDAAIIAVMFHCGLKTRGKLEAAMVTAGLPCVLAEALASTPGRLGDYPVNLPPFKYEE